MNGSLSRNIVIRTIQVLENRCLILLHDGYKEICKSKKVTINCEEEDISKEIIIALTNNNKRSEWEICVIPEFRLYNDDGVPAKHASRIDFYFTCWTNNVEWKYYAESKNLIETNTAKNSRKSKISSKSLQERYIKTGIDNYMSSKYPQPGCLIGYVLQGNVNEIISLVNNHLIKNNRSSEVLTRTAFCLNGFNNYFLSSHTTGLVLKHLMFDFT